MSFAAPKRLPWLLCIAALAFVADRLSKVWVSAHVPLGGAIPIFPQFLRISHWTNEGAAFSMFADAANHNAVRWGLAGFSLLAALVVLAILVRTGSRMTLASTSLALILGGALGNVWDRVAYGSVVDFIEVHIFTYHYPDFNIADSCIVVGACLLLLDSLFFNRKSAQTE